jgi:hypothetical protein
VPNQWPDFIYREDVSTMSHSKKFSGAALATAAAVLFSSAPMLTAHAADEAKVKCEGVNSCKGKSECSTATNGCAGQNSCKGKGYISLPAAECEAAKAKAKKS